MDNVSFLNDKELKILSLIGQDMETGRHLLRDDKCWDMVEKTNGFSKNDYVDFTYNELIPSLDKFNIYDCELTKRQYEIAVRYKMIRDYEFYEAIKHIKRCEDCEI